MVLLVVTIVWLAQKTFEMIAKLSGVVMLVVHETVFVVPPRLSIFGMAIATLFFEEIFQERSSLQFTAIRPAVFCKIAKNAAVAARK